MPAKIFGRALALEADGLQERDAQPLPAVQEIPPRHSLEGYDFRRLGIIRKRNLFVNEVVHLNDVLFICRRHHQHPTQRRHDNRQRSKRQKESHIISPFATPCIIS